MNQWNILAPYSPEYRKATMPEFIILKIAIPPASGENPDFHPNGDILTRYPDYTITRDIYAVDGFFVIFLQLKGNSLMDKYERMVLGISSILSKPQNRDLLYAVMNMNADGGFMFSFVTPDLMGFDEFALAEHQIESLIRAIYESDGLDYALDARPMSERYDEYLKNPPTGVLSENQTARYNAILDQFDDGWSGATEGYIMRMVQHHLKTIISN